ncbi:uncharacterized protein LOC142319976 [Lycorma delicatula]|uniref:uncharacterized protein LOC142319976 n=1 Tax=Lycorma delicatula TaxID=130591 RepID=UPI003F5135DA
MVNAKTELELETSGNRALETVCDWLTEHGLALSLVKCEYIMIAGRRNIRDLDLWIGEHRLRRVAHTKYLGLIIDKSLNFGLHVAERCKSVVKTLKAILILMTGREAPRSSKRRILVSACTSALLFAAPVWYRAIFTQRNAKLC